MECSLIYLMYLYQCCKGYAFTWYIDQSLIYNAKNIHNQSL